MNSFPIPLHFLFSCLLSNLENTNGRMLKYWRKRIFEQKYIKQHIFTYF